MKNAASTLDPLRPRAPDDLKRGAVVAVMGMATLILALSVGVHWHLSEPEGAQVPMWSAMPGQRAPVPLAATALPTPPPAQTRTPLPATPGVVEPVAHDVEIPSIKPRPALTPPTRTPLREKASSKDHSLARESLESREQRNVSRHEQHAEAVARMMKELPPLAGDTGSQVSPAHSNTSAGQSPGYGARIKAAIVPNIVFIEQMPSTKIEAIVKVITNAEGKVLSATVVKKSGLDSWDSAVQNAVYKTQHLPRDTDGTVPSPLILYFHPTDR